MVIYFYLKNMTFAQTSKVIIITQLNTTRYKRYKMFYLLKLTYYKMITSVFKLLNLHFILFDPDGKCQKSKTCLLYVYVRTEPFWLLVSKTAHIQERTKP